MKLIGNHSKDISYNDSSINDCEAHGSRVIVIFVLIIYAARNSQGPIIKRVSTLVTVVLKVNGFRGS